MDVNKGKGRGKLHNSNNTREKEKKKKIKGEKWYKTDIGVVTTCKSPNTGHFPGRFDSLTR